MAEDRLISIVDDDASMRTALVGLVRSLGHRASAFASAEDFLADPAATISDCVVTDIHMPGMSGIELTQRLAASNGPRVIIITARDEAGLEHRARTSGAACYLKKPFDASDLIRCIETALSPRAS